MKIQKEDSILIEYVWGNLSFRPDYVQVGYFECTAPNWPRIYITVPIQWADANVELPKDFLIRMAKEFMNRFNVGDVNESLGKFSVFQLIEKEKMEDIKVSIHEDAASRFNEQGIALISLCQEGGYFSQTQRKGKSNFPDLYSHMTLTDENSRGIKVMMRDGFGKEIAKYFENSPIGLEGDNYKTFVKLCEAIQRAIKPTSTISQKLVEEFVFDWIEERYKESIKVDLIEFLIPKLQNEIAEYEIWIPIADLRTERVVPLGKIEIRPITKEWLTQWQEVSLSDTIPDKYKEKAEFYKERITKPFQGWSASVIHVQADREAAQQIALQETERSLAILRFFSVAGLSPKVNSYVAIMGTENIETTNSLIFTKSKISHFYQGRTDSVDILSLSDELLAMMNSLGINTLSNLLRKEKLTEFEQKILDSITFYSNATREKNLANKILYILTALENLFLQNETEPIMVNLRERIATLIGKDLSEKKKIIKNINVIYALRSKFVHHAEKISDVEELEQFFRYAFLALVSILPKASTFSTNQEFVSSLDDQKLS